MIARDFTSRGERAQCALKEYKALEAIYMRLAINGDCVCLSKGKKEKVPKGQSIGVMYQVNVANKPRSGLRVLSALSYIGTIIYPKWRSVGDMTVPRWRF